MTTYKAFCGVILTGVRMGSWTADELWGNVPVPQKVHDLIDRAGPGNFQRWLIRMRGEGKLVFPEPLPAGVAVTEDDGEAD
jgi:hypothetical protein